MSDTFNLEQYQNKLKELRAAGKHTEAKLLKANAFGIIYGLQGSSESFKRIMGIDVGTDKLNFSEVEIRLVVAMEPK